MLLVVEKTYGNLIRYGFFEDATIELNNVYGWKRHNAQCHKNRPCSSNTDSSIFQSEQGTFINRIESAE